MMSTAWFYMQYLNNNLIVKLQICYKTAQADTATFFKK